MDIGPWFGQAVANFMIWFTTVGAYVLNALMSLGPSNRGALNNAIAVCAHGTMWFLGGMMQALVCGQTVPKDETIMAWMGGVLPQFS